MEDYQESALSDEIATQFSVVCDRIISRGCVMLGRIFCHTDTKDGMYNNYTSMGHSCKRSGFFRNVSRSQIYDPHSLPINYVVFILLRHVLELHFDSTN